MTGSLSQPPCQPRKTLTKLFFSTTCSAASRHAKYANCTIAVQQRGACARCWRQGVFGLQLNRGIDDRRSLLSNTRCKFGGYAAAEVPVNHMVFTCTPHADNKQICTPLTLAAAPGFNRESQHRACPPSIFDSLSSDAPDSLVTCAAPTLPSSTQAGSSCAAGARFFISGMHAPQKVPHFSLHCTDSSVPPAKNSSLI